MNRTRTLFYLILALFLAIIVASLAFNVIDTHFLTQFFIGASVFSVGVVALDFLGIFGDNEDGHGDGHAGGDDFDSDFDPDLGDGHGESHTAGHLGGPTAPVISILAYLRMAVYFFLGFGPTGWVALATERSPLIALALAVPMGILATVAAQIFFRFQRSNTDSTVARTDLVNEAATVTVSLTHTEMGKVRVQVGMTILEQYALAARPDTAFQKGESVRIVKVTPECVFVD